MRALASRSVVVAAWPVQRRFAHRGKFQGSFKSRSDKLCTRPSSRATNTSVLIAYISYKYLRYTLDKSGVKIDRRVVPCAHFPACDFLGFFGNFNFEIHYGIAVFSEPVGCGVLASLTALLKIKNYSPSPSTYFEPLPVSDRKRVSYFFFQHANGCHLFCLSGLNRKLQIPNSYFRVIRS